MNQTMLGVVVARQDLARRPPCSFERKGADTCGFTHCSACGAHLVGIGGGRVEASCPCRAPFTSDYGPTDDGHFCVRQAVPVLRTDVLPYQGARGSA